ncbi:MAG: hypothetical protein IJT77_13460 [Clostridia bacterium]|nr:hypothetical protein [Clostridia bacterium]
MSNTQNENTEVNRADDNMISVRRDTFVTDIGLSGRSVNVLHANNIWTINDLMPVLEAPDKLPSWQGVGKMVFEELKSLLPRFAIVDEMPENTSGIDGDNEWKMVILNRELLGLTGELRIRRDEISPRIYAKLERDDMENLFFYLSITPDQLKRMRNIGVKTAQAICSTITERAFRTYISSFERDIEDNQVAAAVIDAAGKRTTVSVDMKAFIARYGISAGDMSEWLKMEIRGQADRVPGMVSDVVCFYDGDGCRLRRAVAMQIEHAYRSIGIEPGDSGSAMFLGRILSIPRMSESRELIEANGVLIEPLKEIFINNEYVLKAFRERIVSRIGQKCVPVARQQIYTFIPEILRDRGCIDNVLSQLIDEKVLMVQDNLYMSRYEKIRSWIENYPDEKKRQILRLRLNGGTLEDVGQTIGLTRERIRQIVWNCLIETYFHEDYLGPVYETYHFDDEQARLAFGTVEGNYLIIRYKKGKQPLEEALDDDSIPFSVRTSIERALDRDYILDEGRLVRRQNNDVKIHLIKTKCRDTITVPEYINLYYEFCRKYSLDPQNFSLDDQSIANKLHDSRITITTYGRKFRYYPMDATDFTDLYEGLNLRSYKDVELSTQLFFRQHPDLMEQYDIRDACELHNALKKTIDPEEYPDISFGRMPVIRFGKPDREQQVISILMDHAPEISNSELASLYEERYGVNIASFMANYAPYVQNYFFSGHYKLNVSMLPEEVLEKMKSVLTEDFYLTDTIRSLYKENVPGSTGSEIVPLTIRQLGYHPYEGYAIRSDRFKKSTDYIEHMLLGKEEVYISEFPDKLTGLPLYSRLYMGLKQEFEILEVGIGHLMRLSYFESKGVTKRDFERYIEHVSRFPISGRFFSIRSLRKAGFRDPLDKLKMDDWFYASLLQQRPDLFSLQRVSGVKIISKGHEHFNAASVYEQVIREKGPMSPDDLIDYMNKTHGTDVNRGRMLFLITTTQLYYDRLTRMIYLQDEAFEEMMKKRREAAQNEDV